MACSRSRFFTHWIPRFWKLSAPGISHTVPSRAWALLPCPACAPLPLPSTDHLSMLNTLKWLPAVLQRNPLLPWADMTVCPVVRPWPQSLRAPYPQSQGLRFCSPNTLHSSPLQGLCTCSLCLERSLHASLIFLTVHLPWEKPSRTSQFKVMRTAPSPPPLRLFLQLITVLFSSLNYSGTYLACLSISIYSQPLSTGIKPQERLLLLWFSFSLQEM